MNFTPDDDSQKKGDNPLSEIQSDDNNSSNLERKKIVEKLKIFAENILMQKKDIDLSGDLLKKKLFNIFLKRLATFSFDIDDNRFDDIAPLLSEYSEIELKALQRFVLTIENENALEELKQRLAVPFSGSSVEGLVFREGEPVSISSHDLDEVISGIGKFLEYPVQFGKKFEIELLNFEDSIPDYELVCNYISRLIYECESNLVSPEEFIKQIFSKNFIQNILSGVDYEKLMEFLKSFLPVLLKIFEVSRIAFAVSNNLNLSFVKNILENDPLFFADLFEEIKLNNEAFPYSRNAVSKNIGMASQNSREKFVEYVNFLSENVEEREILLNNIYRFFNSDSEGVFNLDQKTCKFFGMLLGKSTNALQLSLAPNEPGVKEFLGLSVNKSIFIKNLFTEVFFRLTAKAQNPSLNDFLQSDESKEKRLGKIFDKVFLRLKECKLVENKSDLIFINCSDSPLDFVRSTDALFVINNGKYKDFSFRFDITTDQTKRGENVFLVSLEWNGNEKIMNNEEDFLRDFDNFLKKNLPLNISAKMKKDIENQKKSVIQGPLLVTSLIKIPGISDFFQ